MYSACGVSTLPGYTLRCMYSIVLRVYVNTLLCLASRVRERIWHYRTIAQCRDAYRTRCSTTHFVTYTSTGVTYQRIGNSSDRGCTFPTYIGHISITQKTNPTDLYTYKVNPLGGTVPVLHPRVGITISYILSAHGSDVRLYIITWY